MLSPTTLTFSVLALVLSPRPFRSGCWFLLGAFTATMAVGILAAIVLGDVAASSTPSTPKTWVAILDVVFGVLLIVFAVRLVRRPPDPAQTKSAMDRMGGLAASPAIAIVGAGALLANPGGFIPIALKAISETDPSTAQYAVEWLFFTIVAVLPLILAVVLLLVRTEWAMRVLEG